MINYNPLSLAIDKFPSASDYPFHMKQDLSKNISTINKDFTSKPISSEYRNRNKGYETDSNGFLKYFLFSKINETQTCDSPQSVCDPLPQRRLFSSDRQAQTLGMTNLEQSVKIVAQNFDKFISKCYQLGVSPRIIESCRKVEQVSMNCHEFDCEKDYTMSDGDCSSLLDTDQTMKDGDSSVLYHGADVSYTVTTFKGETEKFVICPYCEPQFNSDSVLSSFYCVDEFQVYKEYHLRNFWLEHLLFKHGVLEDQSKVAQPIFRTNPSTNRISCVCPFVDESKLGSASCLEVFNYDSNLKEYIEHYVREHTCERISFAEGTENEDGDFEMLEVESVEIDEDIEMQVD
ncbi:hypothetical protein WICPIJ_009534 [Wickerhamomyces pijperi]|uniref:Transcription regulator Rua1 C-terminal domain-containing protein n=1 Tax=Wickerhamomyces pijperi TaxID=599730 RepID=A0A9P8PM42_WICPI|nr:hypothetical protein WICPIJ_009534 [Wickerhamomyces pijperi]